MSIPENWYLNKYIPMGLVFGLIANVAFASWTASDYASRLKTLERKAVISDATNIEMVEARERGRWVERSLVRIEKQIDTIVERLPGSGP